MLLSVYILAALHPRHTAANHACQIRSSKGITCLRLPCTCRAGTLRYPCFQAILQGVDTRSSYQPGTLMKIDTVVVKVVCTMAFNERSSEPFLPADLRGLRTSWDKQGHPHAKRPWAR